MALLYTGDSLIKLIRDSGMIPDVASQGTADADLLDHVNYCMHSEILPEIMKFKEEYFLIRERVSLTATKQRVPSRAISNRIRSLHLNDGTSNTPITQIDRNDIDTFSNNATTSPWAFYIEGNHIVFHPDIAAGSGYSSDISYYFRPGDVKLLADVRKVDAVNPDTKSITLNSPAPSAWTTADKFDIHSGDSGGEIHEWSLSATTVSSTTIVVTTEIDGSVFGRYPVAVGDYVCLEGDAALPGVPREAHPALGQAALCRVLLALGDHDNLNIQISKLKKMIDDFSVLFNARIESHPKIINNRGSIMATTRGLGRRSNSFSR